MIKEISRIESEITRIIESVKCEYSNIHLFDTDTHDSVETISEEGIREGNEHYIIHLCGGLNGHGQFLLYIEDVYKIVKSLLSRFSHVWLIKWENDCDDDIFYLDIGVRN